MHLRALIAEKLAGIATPEELPFFVSLLPGRGTVPDDKIREYAILGLGRLGSDDAVKALQSHRASPNPDIRRSVALALGNTRSPAAVPILIEMYSDEAARNDACLSLATLRHDPWCDGADTTAETQSMWRDWWRTHGSRSTLFGRDQCLPLDRLVPLVKE